MNISHDPPPQQGLEWVDELFEVVPKWTIEPDIAAVEAVTKSHLPPGFKYRASVFAEGAFNKLFLLSLDTSQVTSSPCYIMRVALPVDPYFKTASEVATLKFLSQHTSIPVPQVIAYDTSPDNELGFEWILMTRLPGVPLKDLWPSPELSWNERVQVIKTVSEYIQQMQMFRFDMMGSLYLAGQAHAPFHWLQPSPTSDERPHFLPLHAYPQFVVGPVVAIQFFYGNRIKLTADRGPFFSSCAWIASLLKLQIASVADQKANLLDDDGDENDPNDSDDVSELEGIIQASSELLSLVPDFFKDANNEKFVLHHDDLSTNNILVDPTTHRVTGVVDWECVSFQPLWKVRRPPQLIYGPKIEAEFYESNFGGPIPNVPQPPSASPDEDEDELRSELRQHLEQMLLRRVFDNIFPPNGRSEKMKRIFENKVSQAAVTWNRVVRWANDVKNGSDPEQKETEGDGLYFWPEE